ncbi:Cell wall protein RHD3 [Candida viswanathii]|uniref:Cell wall protein RHD3 n=1 Tax=Candida viswanathii TaxID=5486 RepID=A0A367XSA7_9ASCO|nr:Cell wall protein RHD3 [Candida viswanathii]
MRSNITRVAATLMAIAVATIYSELIPIRLFVKSKNETLNGMGLYSLHEGEGYNFFFLGQPQEAQDLVYDTRMFHIYFYYHYFVKYKFTVCINFLQLSYVHYPFKVKIKKNGDLTFTGYKKMYAVQNVDDPHSFSSLRYALYNYKDKTSVPPAAVEVSLVARRVVQ